MSHCSTRSVSFLCTGTPGQIKTHGLLACMGISLTYGHAYSRLSGVLDLFSKSAVSMFNTAALAHVLLLRSCHLLLRMLLYTYIKQGKYPYFNNFELNNFA